MSPDNLSMFKQVQEFQTKILNKPVKATPVTTLDPWFTTHLPTYINEELEELKAAINDDDLPETADALIDLIYFALGGLHQLGVDGDEAFRVVHRANMAKSLGVKPARGLQGDATKSDDWTPPDLSSFFQ